MLPKDASKRTPRPADEEPLGLASIVEVPLDEPTIPELVKIPNHPAPTRARPGQSSRAQDPPKGLIRPEELRVAATREDVEEHRPAIVRASQIGVGSRYDRAPVSQIHDCRWEGHCQNE